MKRVVNYNRGMARGVTHTFTFPDYTTAELVAIMKTMAASDHFDISAVGKELTTISRESSLLLSCLSTTLASAAACTQQPRDLLVAE